MIIWKKKDWIRNPEIDGDLEDRARLLCRLVEDLARKGDQALADYLLEEDIGASWDIENAWLDKAGLSRAKGAQAMLASSVSHDSILGAHRLIMEEEGGAYRDHPESVYDEAGISVYEAPEAADVPALMDRFVEWWNDDRYKLPDFIGAALGHLFFESIHPFADGNGRLGRMLMPCASAAINSDRNRYYCFLNEAQRKGDARRWIAYALEIMRMSLESALRKTERLNAAKKLVFRKNFLANDAEWAIIRAMAFGNRKSWTEFEATKNLPDGEIAEKARRNLIWKGLIRNGALALE